MNPFYLVTNGLDYSQGQSETKIWAFDLEPRNLKGGIGSLLTPVLTAMGWRPYWPSRMEVSYCTFGFGAIIWRDLRTLLLPRNSPRDNLYACMIKVHTGKATHAWWICLAGLATKKSGGTITHLHTWRQDGPHNRFPFQISLPRAQVITGLVGSNNTQHENLTSLMCQMH